VSTKTILKHARALRQKKFRDELGLFLVQGPKLVGELIHAEWPVDSILATAEAALRMGLSGAVIVPAHELDRIGTLESGNEVIALARKPNRASVTTSGADELILALDGIADPGNLGTVIRLADWFGIDRVWCSNGSVEVFNPKCVQSSMGGIFRVSVEYLDLPDALTKERAEGSTIYLATMDGASVFTERLSRRAVLVLGNESHGISEAVHSAGGKRIGIPGKGGAESLNVAMAAAAFCTEFSRQRSSL
jgi:TrmH family RNA methyltransferase